MSNLVGFVEKLTPKEQIIICGAINGFDQNSNMHRGLLPFVRVETALAALDRAADSAYKGRLTYGKLASQLREFAKVDPPNVVRFRMYLVDAKVVHSFGKHPELGRPIRSSITRVTAGLKWSLPKRDYVRDKDVNVPHIIVLKPIKRGLWEITVASHLEEYVKDLLMKYCTE